MKKTANSNMYEVSLANTWDRFGAHLEGSFQAIACIVSYSALSEVAKSAFTSSVSTLGYGEAACTFVTLQGIQGDAKLDEGTAPPTTISKVIEGNELKGDCVFAIIEGLDPLLLIIADDTAREMCSEAYRQPIAAPDKGRLLGRDVVAFQDFEAMLQNNKDKQKAWGLLKRLPRLNS